MSKIKNKEYLIIILILLLAAGLRFYRLPEMAGFDFDQEYAVNFAYNVLRVYPIQLIGQGLSVEGLFMGPWYFYYLVPFFAITGLHPLGGFIGSVVLSLVIILAYFFVGKSLFGVNAGIIATFTRTLLATEITNDISMVPAYGSELLALITWWLFYKYWQGQTKFLPILGFVFGLYTSIHPILFPFYFVFLILLLWKRKLPNIKYLLLSIFAFIIPIVPLIIFEYLHNFLEVKRLAELFSTNSTGGGRSYEIIKYLSLNVGEPQRILALNFIPGQLFTILFLVITIVLAFKGVGFWKDKFHKYFLFITYFIFLIYYTFFPTHIPEYYFQGLTTLAILYISANLALMVKHRLLRILLIIILLNFIFVNIQILTGKWNNSSPNALYNKDVIVQQIIKRTPSNQEFYVSYIKEPGWNFGFNYLFKYYGRIPQTKEAKPPVFTIVIPKSLSIDSLDIISGNTGLILPR